MQEMIKYDTSVNGTWSANNGGLFTPTVKGDFRDATGREYRGYVLAPMSFTRLLGWSKVADQKKTDGRTPGQYNTIQYFRQELSKIFDNCRAFWTPNPADGILLTCLTTRNECNRMLDELLHRSNYYTSNQSKYGGKTKEEKDKNDSEMRRFLTKVVEGLKKEDWYNYFKTALLGSAECEHPDRKAMLYSDVCPQPMWYVLLYKI